MPFHLQNHPNAYWVPCPENTPVPFMVLGKIRCYNFPVQSIKWMTIIGSSKVSVQGGFGCPVDQDTLYSFQKMN